MSKAQDEPDDMQCMGILGRAMARARARGHTEDEEQQVGDAPTRRAEREEGSREGRTPPACERLGVVVGADGVLAEGRFIPYSDVREVRHESVELPGWGYGDVSEGPTTAWSVSLGLMDHRVVKLTDDLESGRGAGDVHVLADAIESAHEAWLALERGPAPNVNAVARGSRAGSAWLNALRQLGSTVAAPYRTLPVDLDPISQILEDVRAAPWARAAAAVVLTASGDATAARRLHRVSATLANPVICAALRDVAEASSDGAIAAALETLHPMRGGRAGARPHHERPAASPDPSEEEPDLDVGDGPPS